MDRWSRLLLGVLVMIGALSGVGALVGGCQRGTAGQASQAGEPPERARAEQETALAARSVRTVARARPGGTTTRRPASVPAEYVPTPNGFFHPSCVVSVAEDEVFGHDLVVRGKDGSVHRTIQACAYPRYSPLGHVIPADGPAPSLAPSAAPPPPPRPAGVRPEDTFYDGWLISYWFTGTLPPQTAVTGKWVVPASPTSDPVTGTDPVTIYYFDDVEMEQGSTIDILQPVLGYGYPDGQTWTITSWNCCTSGIQGTSAAVTVNPGDIIEGTTVGTDCDASAACGTWTVTTKDVTTGQSTVLSTTEPNPPNIVNPGVLEAYGVTACDMLPPGGEETFYDNVVTGGGDGGALPLSYYTYAAGEADSPDCGYGGIATGNDYTLLYGTAPTSIATVTALGASPGAPSLGATVTLTATVTSSVATPAMAGNVTFYDGATPLGTADIVSAIDGSGHEKGTATFAISTLAIGTHTMTATFGGGSGYDTSTSAAASVVIAQIPTTTTLGTVASTASEGGMIALTATVAGSASGTGPAITGTVTFFDGTTSLGSAMVTAAASGATATLSAPAVVGTDAFTAKYSGDASYLASTSAAQSVTVASTLVPVPATATAPPKGSVPFATTGGVTPVAWTFKTNASGGTLSSSGLYRAGAVPGGSDVILATDSAGGTATATITVGAGVSITPSAPSVAPLGAVAFTAAGGSGTGYTWSLPTNGSGGSIDPSTGAYTAGNGTASGATDGVTVTDSLGNTVQTQVTVGAASTTSDAGQMMPTPVPTPANDGGIIGTGSGLDAGLPGALGDDAGTTPNAAASGAGSSGGCACEVRGGGRGERPLGALLATGLVLGVVARRRRADDVERGRQPPRREGRARAPEESKRSRRVGVGIARDSVARDQSPHVTPGAMGSTETQS